VSRDAAFKNLEITVGGHGLPTEQRFSHGLPPDIIYGARPVGSRVIGWTWYRRFYIIASMFSVQIGGVKPPPEAAGLSNYFQGLHWTPEWINSRF